MFSKPNAIIYLRRSGLIIAGKHVAPARLNFPADVMGNLEVLNSEKFVELCQAFFHAHKLRGKRVLFVLDVTVAFTKLIDVNQSEKSDQLLEDFVAAMPFDQGKRACIGREDQQRLQLYATNAELYKAVEKALHMVGGIKLLAITPAAAYELEPKAQLSVAIEQFISDTRVRQHVNFANITPI